MDVAFSFEMKVGVLVYWRLPFVAGLFIGVLGFGD